jgi:hypothetical protein
MLVSFVQKCMWKSWKKGIVCIVGYNTVWADSLNKEVVCESTSRYSPDLVSISSLPWEPQMSYEDMEWRIEIKDISSAVIFKWSRPGFVKLWYTYQQWYASHCSVAVHGFSKKKFKDKKTKGLQ